MNIELKMIVVFTLTLGAWVYLPRILFGPSVTRQQWEITSTIATMIGLVIGFFWIVEI